MAHPNVHPSAIVHPNAVLADDVTVGPYAIIGANVTLGEGCTVASHGCLDGATTLGKRNKIGRHACDGADPQDLRYKGEETFLTVGDDNYFGDFSQVCRGTTKSHDRLTKVGNNCYFMAYTHVAHDCIIGDHVIAANGTQLAGHVIVEDHAHFGGLSAMHQFCLVGRFAFCSGGTAVSGHIPPYVRVAEWGGVPHGLNVVGLRRSGEFPDESLRAIKETYRIFFRQSTNMTDALKRIRDLHGKDKHVEHFCSFIEKCQQGTAASRHISRGRGVE